jgi:hypothetical protein
MRRLNRINVFGLRRPSDPYPQKRPRAPPSSEGFAAAGGNGGKMHENIFAIFALDKPNPFSGVKPPLQYLFLSSFSLPQSADILTEVATPNLGTNQQLCPRIHK